MRDPFDDNSSGVWIPFADFLAGVLSIFLVIAVLLTFHLTDPKNKDKEGDIKSPGTVMVETFWKEDVDVDTWVKSPGDRPVGYSRKQGKVFDLLRDDLGMEYERAANMHHENVFARTSPSGEYIINLHMYSNRLNSSSYPIAVDVVVQIVKRIDADKANLKKIMRTVVNLNEEGQEVTVVRFSLDHEGNLIPDSIRRDPIRLREEK